MSETPQQRSGPAANLVRDLPLYIVARFGLVAVIAAVLLLFNVPLLVAVAVGFVVGLPLGLLLLRGLNRRVTAGLAARNENRARQRARLRAELRGDVDPEQPAETDERRGDEQQ